MAGPLIRVICAAIPASGIANLTSGTVTPWGFAKDATVLRQRVDGPLTCNSVALAMAVIRTGTGIGLIMEDNVRDTLACSSLEQVLDDWCPPFDGIHIHHPGRRRTSLALRLLIDYLRSQAAH